MGKPPLRAVGYSPQIASGYGAVPKWGRYTTLLLTRFHRFAFTPGCLFAWYFSGREDESESALTIMVNIPEIS
jgi:hypothetical protein